MREWASPPLTWGLKPGRIPQKHREMSGVVPVLWKGGRGLAYIRFEQQLVDALAKRMQYGVSPLHPCYLRVLHIPETGIWRLFCQYLDREVGTLLHEYNERPAWLGKLHERKEHVENSQDCAEHRAD